MLDKFRMLFFEDRACSHIVYIIARSAEDPITRLLRLGVSVPILEWLESHKYSCMHVHVCVYVHTYVYVRSTLFTTCIEGTLLCIATPSSHAAVVSCLRCVITNGWRN